MSDLLHLIGFVKNTGLALQDAGITDLPTLAGGVKLHLHGLKIAEGYGLLYDWDTQTLIQNPDEPKLCTGVLVDIECHMVALKIAGAWYVIQQEAFS